MKTKVYGLQLLTYNNVSNFQHDSVAPKNMIKLKLYNTFYNHT